ncbi:tetratricopeptide repeat protein [bacterium]|nr:tetratricopeptide repeat protein [bacterium]
MKSIKILILITLCAFVITGCISPEMRSARIAINENDWERALISLDQELARNPGNAEAYWRKGQCYMKLNDYKMMSTYFDSSLAASEAFKDTIVYYRQRLVKRYIDKSSTAYDLAMILQHESAEAVAAALYESIDDQMEAIKEQEDAPILQLKSFLTMLETLKEQFEAMGWTEEVLRLESIIEEFKEVKKRFETRKEGGIEIGFRLLTEKNLTDAFKDKFEAGNMKEAVDAFYSQLKVNLDTSIIVDPNNGNIYAQAAFWSFKLKKYDEALKYSSGAIDLGDEKLLMPMYEIQMLTYLNQGDHEETIEWAQKIMKQINLDDPEGEDNYLRAFDAITISADSLNNMELALDVTKEAVTKFPDNMRLKKNLAILYARLKDYDSARRVYETVLTVNPNDFDANLTISSILFNDQRWAEAIPYLEKSYEGEPENIKIVTMLMACYFNSDQDDKGQEMREKLEEMRATED